MIPRCLALDVGSMRIGVAVNVGELVLAKESVTRSDFMSWYRDSAPPHDLLLVGIPVDLDGSLGLAASQVMSFVDEIPVPDVVEVRFVDERLTTALASRRLREVGRNSKSSRGVIDAQAAAEILEIALAANLTSPGRKIDEF